jgi:hypothetical protein
VIHLVGAVVDSRPPAKPLGPAVKAWSGRAVAPYLAVGDDRAVAADE